MMVRTVLSLVTVGVVGSYATTAVAAPPVKVEVLIEDDDGDDDFFEDGASSKKKKVTTRVKKNADDAFDDLEEEEARQGKRRRSSDNQNTNTQVVNVVVVGGEQQSKAEAPPPAPPAPQAPAAAPAAPAAPPRPAPPAPPMASVQTEEDWTCWGWFGKDEKEMPKQADLLLFGTAGGYASGGFLGLGAEAYATDVIGLRLVGQIGGYEPNDFGHDRKFFENGSWAHQGVSARDVDHGVTHLVDLALTVHMNPNSSFDPYLALGASHYGYDLRLHDGSDVLGGSVYGRLGVGLNWHIGEFFVGGDAGWYPVEMARYRVERTGSSFNDDGRRRSRDEYEAFSEDIEDHFDPNRFTVSGHIGWRF